ncbi:MAG: hypothetical protein A3G30_06105 [Chlamydiae bacterium RIFCSPLOWO2_12_FULL_49_12]|nr:MAG: hypothetical protein A3G30_06105 [Chlamydiae bacterium RIFCSPLOWO2_12_FULL_49_12]
MPWIISGVISAVFPTYAMIIGLICSLFPAAKLKQGFLLEWGSVLFFFIGTFNAHFVGNSYLTQHFSFCMSLFFVAAAGISLLIGKPFTLQYAKLETDSKSWDHPLFLRINQIMTGGLGIIFLGVFLVNLYRYFHPGILNGRLVWIIAILLKIIFVYRFPNWYKTRYLLKESDENHGH